MTKTHTDTQTGWREEFYKKWRTNISEGGFWDRSITETNMGYVSDFIQQILTQQAEEIFEATNEIIGKTEQHDSGSNSMDDERITRNDLRAQQRTQLQKLKERYTIKSS